MYGQSIAPTRRLRFFLTVLIALAAGACTLNTAPNGVQQITISGAPVVQIAAPQPNATYLEGVAVNVQALVTNAGADIARVDVTVDGSVVASPTNPNAAGGPTFGLSQPWNAAGAGPHTITVTAFRADGSASQPASVTISVVSSVAPATEEASPTAVASPTTEESSGDDTVESSSADDGNGEQQVEAPTEQPAEEPTPTNTPGKPVATFNQGVNVRRGPGTNFEPPIGAFAAGQTADLLAVNPGATWYKVRYYNADGWVFGSLLTVAGDTSGLPVEAGPPTPVPVPPTPIPPTGVPATAVPQTKANLVAGFVRLDPKDPTCNVGFKVNVDIANLGDEDTANGGTFRIEDIVNGEVKVTTEGPIPEKIKKGETVKSADIPIMVSVNFNEEHTIRVTLNANSNIPETTHDDNVAEKKYQLKEGDCDD